MYYLDALKVCLREVGTTRKYRGYRYKVIDVLTILICGCLCGLKNISDIHTYATTEASKTLFLKEFKIESIPSYVQMTRILSIVDIDTLNSMFSMWAVYVSKEIGKSELSRIDEEIVALDGKTIRSTTKMKSYEKALHIVSAYATNTGITLGQLATESKSNEIPAVRELIRALDVKGTIIVTDALSCQKETIETIINAEADYVIPVKGNQKKLMNDIKEELNSDTNIYVTYDKTFEENRGRLEKREAWVLNNVSFLEQSNDWKNLRCVGMINSSRYIDGRLMTEIRYYISSLELTPLKLIECTRNEWRVESMHWLLDINFREDDCRLNNDSSQKNLNALRKLSLNIINIYKKVNSSKMAISKVMLNCLLKSDFLLKVINSLNG